jgi:hypothetical protein
MTGKGRDYVSLISIRMRKLKRGGLDRFGSNCVGFETAKPQKVSQSRHEKRAKDARENRASLNLKRRKKIDFKL